MPPQAPFLLQAPAQELRSRPPTRQRWPKEDTGLYKPRYQPRGITALAACTWL